MTRVAFLSTALVVTACTRKPPPEQYVHDGWGEVRAELTSGKHCFAEQAEYCVTEQAFVDGAIKPRLDALYGGEMPLRRAHVEATKRASALAYKKAQMTPEAIAIVESNVEARYQAPKIDASEDLVNVDFGVVPGKLAGHPGALELTMEESPLAENGAWLEAEARLELARFAKQYPEVPLVRLVVSVPTKVGLGRFVYRLDRVNHHVYVTEPSKRVRVSEAFADDTELPRVKLSLDALTVCRIAGSTAGPECPPDLDANPPAEAKQ